MGDITGIRINLYQQKNWYMKIWKYSGTLLAATGVLHTIVAIILGWDSFVNMFRNGLINSTEGNVEHAFAFWFLICGIFLIFLGQTLQYYIKKEQKPAPLSLGYALLVMSIIGCFIEPVSGFWLFIPQALIIILAKRNKV